MAKQSLHSPEQGLGRFVSPERLALIVALGLSAPALANAQPRPDAGITADASGQTDASVQADRGNGTTQPTIRVSTTPGEGCANALVCVPVITFNIQRVETINVATVNGPIPAQTTPVPAAAPTVRVPAVRRRPARRTRPAATTTTAEQTPPSGSSEGTPVNLSTTGQDHAIVETQRPAPAAQPTSEPTPTREAPLGEDTSNQATSTPAPVNAGTGGYFEVALGGSVLIGTHTDQELNAEITSPASLRITAGNPTPELSAAGPTGRFLVRLTVGGGSGNYTINIPGANITNTTGGNNFNIIAPAGMYTATVTDNATQNVTTVPLTVAATRITAGQATGPSATTSTERTIDRNTLTLPTVTLRAGGRPVSFFDISGSLTWGIAIENSSVRDSAGTITDTTTNVNLDTLAVGMRLGFVAGPFMIGTESVATVSGINRGFAQTLALQLATSNNFKSAWVFNLNAGFQVPFSDTARTGGNDPMFTGTFTAGYRFR